MPIRQEKIAALEEEMKELGINPEDILEKFITGSGPGGQKINKSQTCVYLKHLPTGIEVKCQKGRSRESNRFYARRILLDKIKEEVFQLETAKKTLIEKIRRQKKRRSRKAKEKCLEDKKSRSKIKEGRASPSPYE